MRWSRREGAQEGSGRSREAFCQRSRMFGCVCSCAHFITLAAAAGTNPCRRGPAVPDAKHFSLPVSANHSCRSRRNEIGPPLPLALSSHHQVMRPFRWARGGKGWKAQHALLILDPTTHWCKDDGNCISPKSSSACDKQKEGERVEILEASSILHLSYLAIRGRRSGCRASFYFSSDP